jgi:hypothetical protein
VKRLTVFFPVILIAACSSRSSVPKDIIPSDSMYHIMKDVIMAEEYSSQYIAKDSLLHDKVKANQDLLGEIFKLHHTTKAEFQKSLSFYESRPDLNKVLFDSLAADVNRHKPANFSPRTVSKPLPAHGPVKLIKPHHIPMK